MEARAARTPAVALTLGLVLAGCPGAPSLEDAAPAPDASVGDAPALSDAGPPHEPRPFTPTPATIAYCAGRDDAAIEARITEMLGRLSLAEKIAMMAGSTGPGVDGTWAVPGNERIGVWGLHMLDGPRGLSAFSNRNGTAFPVAMMRGATWDPALEERVGHAMGVEHRSAGADVILAPTINLLRHPRWGRAQETYSEDTHHMGAMGVAFVRGVQDEGVLASVKHFAVNSIEDTRHEVDVTIDERTLRELYLPHFRRVVVEGRVASVMSAYNQVNGAYCDVNEHLLSEILAGDWGFSGFVESDWIWGTHGDAEPVLAGLDIEMPFASEFRRLPAAVARGDLSEHEIDDSVRRILRAQLCFGLDETPRPPRTRIDDPSRRETAEHLALAREVARRGIVLLRNEPLAGGAPALPLEGVRSIALLGRNVDVENIGDSGSSNVDPSDVVTALEGIAARAGAGVTLSRVEGTTLDASDEAAVRASDVAVIVTGLQSADEGESDIGAGDRDSLALPADELALIRAVAAIHERVVVVLEGGSALLTAPFEDEVEAVLFAFYPGSEGGHAIAEILFGDASPSGRLPFSIPTEESDLPPFDSVSTEVTYDFFHGYRHLLRERIERGGRAPAHAFGEGLSYTRFELSGLALSRTSIAPGERIEVSARVTNTGGRAGIETVQVYVAPVGSVVPRAPHDLRAFAQVALEPGASATVTLPLDSNDLAYWDVETNGFVVEAIDYEVRLARSSEDVVEAATLSVR